MYWKICTASIALFMSACSIQPTHQSLQGNVLPELVPVRDFVANVESKSDYLVSPDGKKLAWKQVAGTRAEIFVRTLGKEDTRSLGFDAQSYPFVWAADSRNLLFIMDTDGNENFHLFRVDINDEAQSPVDITPLENTQVKLQKIINDDPDNILIKHNKRDKTVFDLYRINIHTGDMKLIYENHELVSRYIIDQQGQLRARVRQENNIHYLDVYESDIEKWKGLISWGIDDYVHALRINKKGDKIYLLSNQSRDKIALVSLDISTAAEEVIYAHPDVDISMVQFDEQRVEPALVYIFPDYPQVIALNPSLQNMLDSFLKDARTGLYITSNDTEQRMLTLIVNTDRERFYYLYDRNNEKSTLLGEDAHNEFAGNLSTMTPVKIASRDNLTLHGYLTLPHASKRPLPMVLLAHGGPYIRDFWHYDQEVQFLANRGYAVLQINNRGSYGYGRKFKEAAIGELAGKVQDDLLDSVDWAIQQGIADPKHIAIMGTGFGGYATLVGLTMTPKKFACGIDIMGPADLETFDRDSPAHWKPYKQRLRKYLGDPDNEVQREEMRKQSPLYYADQVERPVLIIQGANDVRVKQSQSDRMVQALRKSGKDVVYKLIKDEGHEIRHWKNKLDVYRTNEDFLASCLGGRSSGFDYFQLGSWLF